MHQTGHGVIRQSFKQQIEIIYKLEITICATVGNKLTLLDVANGKAVCRMSQICQPFLSTKRLILQLCLRPSSPFRVGKILIYAMPNNSPSTDLNVASSGKLLFTSANS